MQDLELYPSSAAKKASSGEQFINKFFLPLNREGPPDPPQQIKSRKVKCHHYWDPEVKNILQKTGKLDVGQQNLFSYNKYNKELLAAMPRSKGMTDAMSTNNGLRNMLSMPDELLIYSMNTSLDQKEQVCILEQFAD